MGWTAPRTWVPDEVLTAALLNAQLRDNLLALEGPALSPPVAILGGSATQNLSNGVTTALIMDVEDEDTHNGHTTGSTAWICPAGWGGVYHVTANVQWAANTVGNRYLYLYKNGAATRYRSSAPAASGSPMANVSGQIRLAAGNWVEAMAYQNSGGSLDIVAAYVGLAVAFVRA